MANNRCNGTEIGTEGNEDPGEVEQRRTDPIIFEYRGQFP